MGKKAMRHRSISLFTGAGGLDLGLEAAGFQTRAAVEFDEDAVATLRANRDWPVLHRDIHEVPSAELLAVAEAKEGDIDLVAGGPPCQPFSKSGYWARGDARRLADPRASTLEAFLRVIRDTKPKVFLLENVPGISYRRKDEGLQLLDTTIRSINHEAGTKYSFSVQLLRAAEYGVPQLRERVFVIGHREGLPFTFPPPTHHLPDTLAEQSGLPYEEQLLHPCHTAWDAIGDLQDTDDPSLRASGRWADLLPSIPEGENYLYHTDRGSGLPLFGWRRRYWSFLLKLAKALPAWTITAQPGPAIGPFHWNNRKLSTIELARLQTFPDGYKLIGKRASVQRQLGNAVPSALIELLGYEIRSQLLGDTRTRPSHLTLLPPRRTPVPAPERVRKVAAQYSSLAGDHKAHPGTGKGYSATKRER